MNKRRFRHRVTRKRFSPSTSRWRRRMAHRWLRFNKDAFMFVCEPFPVRMDVLYGYAVLGGNFGVDWAKDDPC